MVGEQTPDGPADKVAQRSEARIELARQVAAFEHAALKPLYLLNGGGAVALLAFIGQIWSRESADQLTISGIAVAISFYIFGLIFAAVATLAGYAQQQFFFKASGGTGKRAYTLAGHTARLIAWLMGLASLASFAAGSFRAVSAFTGRAVSAFTGGV